MRILILLASFAIYTQAQWLNYPDPRTPRTKDGKPNLIAPAPRLNGKPDLSGLWEADATPRSELDRALPILEGPVWAAFEIRARKLNA